MLSVRFLIAGYYRGAVFDGPTSETVAKLGSLGDLCVKLLLSQNAASLPAAGRQLCLWQEYLNAKVAKKSAKVATAAVA